MLNKNFYKELDKIFSILLIVLSVILLLFVSIIIKKPIYILLGFFMLFTGIIWLYIRKKEIVEFNSSNKNYLILNIIFFITLLISIIILYLRPDEYIRPLSYFVLTAVMAGVIALEIFFSPEGKYNTFILLQIIIIGLSLSLSQLFLFPTLIGVDPWWHQMFTSMIISSNHIPTGDYPYSKIPIFHLLITTTSIITGLNYKLASITSISIPLILISVLFTYIIGKNLINDKIGLLASLVLVISNYFINGGIWAIPTTLGGIFTITIVYLLLNLRERKSIITPIIAVILMFVLILTHTIVSTIMVVILFSGWLSLVVYNYLYEKPKNYFSFTIVLFFTSAMLVWWSYASGTLTKIVDLIQWGLKVDPSLSNTPIVAITYISNISLNQQIFLNLGTFILFSLSILGLFFLISKKYSNDKNFLFGFISVSPLLIAFTSILMGYSVIEGRWLFIAEILLSLPISLAIIIILNQFSNKKSKVGILFGIIFILSFFMIMNSNISNIDNHQFYPDGGVRFALTMSEVQSFETMSSFGTVINTDDYYLFMNSSLTGSELKQNYSISEGLYKKNLINNTNNDSIILLRDEIKRNPFSLFGAIYKLNYDVNKLMENEKYSIVYDSGNVSGYKY